MRDIYLILSAGLFLFCCGKTSSLRPPNGTKLQSSTWELPIGDTSRIFYKENNIYVINSFDDSLLRKKDTIIYKSVDKEHYRQIFGSIDQVVVNSSNKNIEEVYRINNEGVYLAGYLTADSIRPYTVFDPPIMILPAIDIERDSTVAEMKTWNNELKSFEKSIKTYSIVELQKTGKMQINKIEDDFYLYELTITRDEVVYFGDKDLIVPEAIVLKSKLLYGKSSGLSAEWGIRSKKEEQNANDDQKINSYLELNKFSLLTN